MNCKIIAVQKKNIRNECNPKYKYSALFGLASAGFLGAIIDLDNMWALAPVISSSISFGLLSIASLKNSPKVFLKNTNGTLSKLTYLTLLPFHAGNNLLLYLYGKLSKHDSYNKIIDHIYLGRKLYDKESQQLQNRNIKTTLDLTSEFKEASYLRESTNYINIPLLDGFAPTVAQLKFGVIEIKKAKNNGNIYIHCALGNSRSATFVAAYLLESGQEKDIESAEKYIQSRRPGVKISQSQKKSLDKFLELKKTEDDK